MSKPAKGIRYAEIERETNDTRIRVVLDLDGGTRQDVSTGIPFFDHMLQQLAFHGCFDLGISAEGDLGIDDHHTVEDVAIVLGQAFRKCLTDSERVERYASIHTPMDEALILVAVDISGRGGFHGDLPFTREKIGMLSTECVVEFFRIFAINAHLTLHIRRISGENNHHLCEAAFKGVGQALSAATRATDRRGVASTKGIIG